MQRRSQNNLSNPNANYNTNENNIFNLNGNKVNNDNEIFFQNDFPNKNSIKKTIPFEENSFYESHNKENINFQQQKSHKKNAEFQGKI